MLKHTHTHTHQAVYFLKPRILKAYLATYCVIAKDLEMILGYILYEDGVFPNHTGQDTFR